jgi:ABC-type glycerol-3-phosphate transport system substrate-binding protein
MNKKAIGLLVVLGLTATLAACGGGGTTGGESPAASPSESPAASPTTSP